MMPEEIPKHQRKRRWELLGLGVAAGSIFFSLSILKPTGFFAFQILPAPKIEAGAALPASPLFSVAPEYFYFTKNKKSSPRVSALAYLVGDLETGEVLLAKNKDKRLPIASVSKLMTAATSLDTLDLGREIKISREALQTEGENGNFRLNEKFKLGEMLYALLLESSNDAAEAIARAGGRDTFIHNMNTKASSLGLTGTTFTDPSGLSPANQSTPRDLFQLVKYLNEHKPGLLQITTQKSYKDGTHTWFSNSQFLRKEGYLGGKSGYTDIARETGVSIFAVPLGEGGTRNIGITLLHTPDRAKDVDSILKFLKKNIYYGQASSIAGDMVRQGLAAPEEEEPNNVKLTFLGDIMLDRGVKNSVKKNFNGDYSALFDKMDSLKKADIAFANLEGPASDQGADLHNLYSFRMDPSVVPVLRGAGLDILALANNHIGDWGRGAFSDTINRLKENEILYTGGGKNWQEASQPTVMEKNGIKIGFLGFSDKGPNAMAAGVDTPGILLASDPNFDSLVAQAAEKVDFLVVSFHFGEEYQPRHDARQENLAHRAIDAGAKIVVGHHPHVIEDTEVYKNGYIAYSLGNFIFDQPFSARTMEGMLLEINLSKNGGLTVKKDTLKLSKIFKPESILPGKEEKIKFP